MTELLRAKIEHFCYGQKEIIASINLTIAEGETIAIMAPSGAGKTTLVRILAKLEPLKSNGLIANDPMRPRVGLLSQDFDAFPWMTVAENIWRFRPQQNDMAKETRQLLREVGLENLEGYFPRQLSGGMRKRLALARILSTEADVVLLDEPFASLDLKTKKSMISLLRAFQERQRFGICIVTHDIVEAASLAQRVLICDGPPLRIKKIAVLSGIKVNEAIALLEKLVLDD